MPIFCIIGNTKTIHTAILVVEYLKKRLGNPHSDIAKENITYREIPNGEPWKFEIGVIVEMNLKDSNAFVDNCRAFVAGRGEIWT